jgi:hypothetical protein
MPVPAYEHLLRDLGCTVGVHTVEVQRGDPDTVYVARR